MLRCTTGAIDSASVRQAFVNGGRRHTAFVQAYIQSPVGLYP